ncbi:hypothetical protein D3C71_19610 [compost metagenome]
MPKATTTRTPRLSAAERRAQEAQARAKAQEQFEASRAVHWTALFAKAARVALLMPGYREVCERNDWWFDDFRVNADVPSISLEGYGGENNLTEANMTPELHERFERELDNALEWFAERREERERERLAAEELRRKQAAARAKLTPEDIEALGLPRTFN